MRLDKFLANSGIGTRKEVKIILKKGKITVNEKIVKDAKIQIDEIKDNVKIEGEKITYKPFVYIMMNKPSGVISATEDGKHKTVIDLLCEKYKNYKVFPVGRLDIDTEGLLLLTNDGVLAHNLLSPKKHVDKKYYVELKEPLTIEKKKILENGIKLEENFVTKKAKIEIIDKDKVKDKNKNINTNTNNEKNERSAYNNDNIEGKLETTNIDKKSENISQNINNDDGKAKEEKDTINKEETNIVLEKEDINSVFEVIDKDIEQEQKKEEDKENLEKLKTEENIYSNNYNDNCCNNTCMQIY